MAEASAAAVLGLAGTSGRNKGSSIGFCVGTDTGEWEHLRTCLYP